MSSLDRLHKFADLLCQALPDFDRASLSPRPLDEPESPVHVGWLRTRRNDVRVLFCTSATSNFVPMALVSCEDTQVAVTLGNLQEFVADRPAPPIGFTFDMTDGALVEMGAAGGVLLKPSMLQALSGFEDGLSQEGEAFEPRLVVYLNAQDLALAREDFPALIRRFGELGRSVFLSRGDFAAR